MTLLKFRKKNILAGSCLMDVPQKTAGQKDSFLKFMVCGWCINGALHDITQKR